MIKKTQFLVLFLLAFTYSKVFAEKSNFEKSYLLVFEEQYTKANELNATLNGAEKEFISGEIAFKKGDVNSASSFYNNAATEVKSPWGFIGLGRLSLQNKDEKSASANFDRAVKNDKKNPLVYEAIVRVCLSMATPDTAIASVYLEKGLERDSKYAPFQTLRGDLSSIKGDFGAAANDYERALYFDASDVEASRKLGVLYTRAKNYKDALNALKKSIESDPDQISVYKNLGDLYYTFGKYADAEENYEIYMSRSENSVDDLERYAFIKFFNKKYKESSDLLDQLLAKGASQSVLYRVKGYVACETGDVKAGLDYMQKFFATHNPDKIIPSDYGYYAKLLSKDGKDSLAAVNFEKAASLDSTNTEYVDALADLYSKQRNHLGAISAYKKLITLQADPSTMNYNIGLQYYYLGSSLIAKAQSDSEKSTAIEYLKNGIQAFKEVQILSPDFYGGYLWEGRLNSLLDPESNTSASKEAYEKALEIVQKDPAKNAKTIIECLKSIGWYYIANAERANGAQALELKKQGLEKYQQVLSINPNDEQAKAAIAAYKK